MAKKQQKMTGPYKPKSGASAKPQAPVPGPGGGSPPGGRRTKAQAISHFSDTHTKHGQGYGNARALRKLYRGGAPTAQEQAAFAKDHPLFVKNHSNLASRLLGTKRKKGKNSG